ncbi:hypothetical protein FOCC_FOCC001625 [Frankliniella occidentalis]|nr:hypothetical protein FOCC_FOCC001625 [Frankliniella occidentalis]
MPALPPNPAAAPLGLLLLLAAWAPTAVAWPAATRTRLVQVQVVFRHGARTPTAPYPNDPHKDYDYKPFGLGHLTALGRHQAYVLGQWLRSRYVDSGCAPASEGALLDAEYAEGAVRVTASAIERTQESAAAVLAGLFPPGPSQTWGVSGVAGLGRLWFPIAYRVVPADQDHALAGTAPCPGRHLAKEALNSSGTLRERTLRVIGGQDTLDYIEKHSGVDLDSDPTALGTVFSALQCQELLNMTIPEWSGRVYPEPLKSATNVALESHSYTPLLRRQTYGDLIAWLLSSARAHETEPRLQLYSAHDATVTALIAALGLQPQEDAGFGIPDFSACVLLELHQGADGALGLKFFYRREPGGPVVRMVPKGCGALCPLERFERLVEDELPRPGDCDLPPPPARAALQEGGSSETREDEDELT